MKLSLRAIGLAVLAGTSACTGIVSPRDDQSGGSGAAGASSGTGSGGGTGSGSAKGTGGGQAPPVQGTDPGRITVHRLNRVEYNNTVRDLLGTTRTPADDFPVDDRGAGFDNVADVLTLSPLHLDSFRTAASTLLDEALTVAAQRTRLITCDLAKQGATCARAVLTAFTPLAWRRPVTAPEIDALMGPVTLAMGQGDSAEVGLKLSLQAILMSPHFLFRVEKDPSPLAAAPHPLNPYEVASRLSYFIWSSMPDGELFAAAKAGTLTDPAAIKTQVERMLTSFKAQALVANFAGQWLYTRQIAEVSPDPTLFPQFDASLRVALKLETETLFQEVALNGLAADKLLTADFTFANDRLAKYYGLPAVSSTTPMKVPLTGNTQRGGILSQAGFLTVTSHQDKTSPVLRGKWVMTQLLCLPAPPPPANVNTMLDPAKVTGTLRDQLMQHRTDPSCAICHNTMDPIGLALENYDAVGAYRTRDAGSDIDASGQLPDGRQFNGRQELAALVANDPNFSRCLAQHLYTYALGRTPDLGTPGHMDPWVLYNLAKSFQAGGFQFKDLVAQIATAATFLNRRGEP
jgi:hypothetical protein